MASKHHTLGTVLSVSLSVCLVLAMAMLSKPAGIDAASPEGTLPTPTPTWINLYGMESLLDGRPLPPGTVIEAFDPQGVRCGRVVVERPGQYGLMPVYGDDLSTPQDEGALPGDLIELRVNSLTATTGPVQVVWGSLGDLLRVEIAASSSASYPMLR